MGQLHFRVVVTKSVETAAHPRITLVALCTPSEALAVLAVLIRERVPHHPAVQAERAAVGGVHFLAFRAPLVRHWFVN